MRKLFKKPQRVQDILRKNRSEKDLDKPKEAWQTLSSELEINIKHLKETIGQSDDVVFREYNLQLEEVIPFSVVFVDGLADKEIINEYILEALTKDAPPKAEWTKNIPREEFIRTIRDRLLTINEVKIVSVFPELITAVLSGESAIIFDGYDEVILANTRGWAHRGIEEPVTETAVRGPRVGFNEIMKNNTAQIRRWIRDPSFRVKNLRVGKRSQTDLSLAYIEGVANPRIIDEVRERLEGIEIDGVLESAYLEEHIEDSIFSVFPTVQTTERADRVAAGLLEGRVAIVTDNTPFVMMVPVTFWQLYYAAEDYYHRWPLASLLRFVRFLAFGFSLFLPAFYIALAAHSPELIPFKLAVAIAGTREGVPFPVFFEALLMEVAIEVIREASARLPGPLGQTLGIVGGFILGDAAVRAGLISPIITIVVALTAISSFTAPSYSVAIATRILRFPLMLIAIVGGLFGLSMASILIIVHLASIKSFGIPYLAPITPYRPMDVKDTFFRVPWWAMNQRPGMYQPVDKRRQRTKENNWWNQLFSPPSRQDDKGGQRS